MNLHLQQFAYQLKDWSQTIIDHGRTPFRRVDCFLPIDTDAGILRPPLLFWINKQSMMAGGLILLPEQDLDRELQRGRSCATALGLSHFVTWETEQVRLWGIVADAITEQHRFPLPGADHPDYFRTLLNEVVDALKIPAITGAIAQHQLSHHYFSNLFKITLELACPALTEAYRRQRADDPEGSLADVDHLANEANRLLLLQILTAYRHNLLPDTLLPEQLEKVLQNSLQQAPEPLCANLCYQPAAAPASLPVETAVCYHHLLLRLHQLDWKHPAQRLHLSLKSLIASWYPDTDRQPSDPAAGMVYPNAPVTGTTTRMLITDSPLLPAATAIVRQLESLPPLHSIYGSVFQLDPDDLPAGTISARLLNTLPIPRVERGAYSVRLRVSWPHRSLKVTVEQPCWRWELIHLLGLCRPGQRLMVEVPVEALRTAPDDPFWTILQAHYRIISLHAAQSTTLRLSLVRLPQDAQPIGIRHDTGIIELTPAADIDGRRAQILHALGLQTENTLFAGTETKPATTAEKNLKQGLIEQLTTYGIPNFPDQYLYFLENPVMVRYTFTPPLQLRSSFLGQFELEDAGGRTISGYGEELQQALLICAQAGRHSIELPGDRHHLEMMLQRYRKDLNALYRYLCDLSYRHLEATRSARKLIKQTWKKLNLPAPGWFKN